VNRDEFTSAFAALLFERVQTLIDAHRTAPFTQAIGEATNVLSGAVDVAVWMQRQAITRGRKYRRDHDEEVQP
jgi:hypothetical protein